ncbi:MAG: hypothetical protein IJZ40_01460, partial [Bacteroidaceae bacterium]|nr:hypothetical protein [Bacteroidaceae bacterium]
MADLKLTQVPTLTDFDYMLLVKGDQVAKMEKATLATVVAEQLYKGSLGSADDLDDRRMEGCYNTGGS